MDQLRTGEPAGEAEAGNFPRHIQDRPIFSKDPSVMTISKAMAVRDRMGAIIYAKGNERYAP